MAAQAAATAAEARSAWHGSRGDPHWEAPRCVTVSEVRARPDLTSMDASEYLDTDKVLGEKVVLLCSMLEASQNFTVYTGAGLSTAAGIADIASRASGSIVGGETCGNRLQLQPTFSHRVLVALERTGVLQHWVQQNHDGLAQKAGYPFLKLNEIHGGWFDRTNPVVQNDGTLRPDLWAWLQVWAERADLVVVLGSSLSGMEADHLARRVAGKASEGVSGAQGLVIVNLQRTPLDGQAQLRIFAPIDKVMRKVAARLRLKLEPSTVVHSPYPTSEDLKAVRRRARELGVTVRI